MSAKQHMDKLGGVRKQTTQEHFEIPKIWALNELRSVGVDFVVHLMPIFFGSFFNR